VAARARAAGASAAGGGGRAGVSGREPAARPTRSGSGRRARGACSRQAKRAPQRGPEFRTAGLGFGLEASDPLLGFRCRCVAAPMLARVGRGRPSVVGGLDPLLAAGAATKGLEFVPAAPAEPSGEHVARPRRQVVFGLQRAAGVQGPTAKRFSPPRAGCAASCDRRRRRRAPTTKPLGDRCGAAAKRRGATGTAAAVGCGRAGLVALAAAPERGRAGGLRPAGAPAERQKGILGAVVKNGNFWRFDALPGRRPDARGVLRRHVPHGW
jgi:hypothetical protein